MAFLEILGFDKIQNLVSQIKDNASKPELMEDVGEYMRSSTVKKLKEQKFKNNPPPTSEFTKSLRHGENKGSGKTLLDNGYLFNSIGKKIEGNSVKVGATNIPTKKKTFVGTASKYAKIHNEGGTLTAKKNFLYIPGNEEVKAKSQVVGVRDTINFFKSEGYKVFYQGRTVRYYKPPLKKDEKAPVMFYLKKSVTIPKREYLYISDVDEKVIQARIKKHIFGGIK